MRAPGEAHDRCLRWIRQRLLLGLRQEHRGSSVAPELGRTIPNDSRYAANLIYFKSFSEVNTSAYLSNNTDLLFNSHVVTYKPFGLLNNKSVLIFQSTYKTRINS